MSLYHRTRLTKSYCNLHSESFGRLTPMLSEGSHDPDLDQIVSNLVLPRSLNPLRLQIYSLRLLSRTLCCPTWPSTSEIDALRLQDQLTMKRSIITQSWWKCVIVHQGRCSVKRCELPVSVLLTVRFTLFSDRVSTLTWVWASYVCTPHVILECNGSKDVTNLWLRIKWCETVARLGM